MDCTKTSGCSHNKNTFKCKSKQIEKDWTFNQRSILEILGGNADGNLENKNAESKHWDENWVQWKRNCAWIEWFRLGASISSVSKFESKYFSYTKYNFAIQSNLLNQSPLYDDQCWVRPSKFPYKHYFIRQPPV